jgi:hypothetical protein
MTITNSCCLHSLGYRPTQCILLSPNLKTFDTRYLQ